MLAYSKVYRFTSVISQSDSIIGLYEYLYQLVYKYFYIAKILSTEDEFIHIEENQNRWKNYFSGWTKEGYKVIDKLNGWSLNAVKIQENLIEIHELRIKQLQIIIQFLLDDD